MPPRRAPNLFNLSGEGVTVTYSTTSIDGKPRLTFKKGRNTLNFSGDEIDSVGTNIGTLVSVVVATVSDKSVTSFSVLLPAIRLPDSKKQAFRTIGITTVAATTIAGPPPGAQQTYKTVALRGSAEQVEF
jgi:hypothetical protein